MDKSHCTPDSGPSEMPRTKDGFSHGEGLVPLVGMNLGEIEDFDAMLRRMSRTSFQGRVLGRAADVLEAMFTEPDGFVVLTISGALTVGQQGPIFVELIRSGLVHAVVGTGALVIHDIIENLGYPHFVAPAQDDALSHEQGVCRVYDSAELETSFCAFEDFVIEHFEEMVPAVNGGEPEGSAQFCKRLGDLLLRHHPSRRSIVSAAAEAGIPVYIPAFTDTEMALNLQHRMLDRRGRRDDPFQGAIPLPFNPFADLLDFMQRVEGHRKGNLGIFTLGGGVPRNWAQQVAPALDILGLDGYKVRSPRFSRGVRICPDPVDWGHLSGCTYAEGVSWAKFLPEDEGGMYAEVHADATLVLPLLVKGVLQRLDRAGRRPRVPSPFDR